MLNLPANIVRKAAGTVSSTVNSSIATVASVAKTVGISGDEHRLKDLNNELEIINDSKEKLNLHLKSTPSKDARTIQHFSIKSDHLLKRNEQGNYQKRFICLVPHTFLYYYDNDISETPRGVIDLELFTNISVSENVLKISTASESARSYFLQFDDKQLLNDWLTCLLQDRFQKIKDERDAYKQIQDQFSGEMNSKVESFQISVQDRDRLNEELKQATKVADESLTILKQILVRFAISEDEMKTLDNAAKVGEAISKQIDLIHIQNDDNTQQITELHKLQSNELFERIRKLEESLHLEKEQNSILEDANAKLKSELEQQSRDAIIELEKINMNFQIAVNAKTQLESKYSALSDQKKLLIKEVKQLRTKVEQSTETITQLKSLNDRLSTALSTLKDLSSSTNDNNVRLTAAVNELSLNDQEDKGLVLLSEQLDFQISNEEISSIDDNFTVSNENYEKKNLSATNNSSDWQIHNQTLKEFNWLSSEQRDILDKLLPTSHQLSSSSNQMSSTSKLPAILETGYQEPTEILVVESQVSHEETASPPLHINSPTSSLLSIGSFHIPSSNTSFSGLYGSSTNISSPAAKSRESRILPKDILSSLFGSDKTHSVPMLDVDDDVVNDDSEAKTSDGENVDAAVSSLSSKSTSFAPDSSSTVVDNKLRCLRCNGTVEGPKYSTCKCVVPALSQDDLCSETSSASASSGSSIMGMFRSSLAKTVYSGRFSTPSGSQSSTNMQSPSNSELSNGI